MGDTAKAPAGPSDRLVGVQYLRAFAALQVVIYHASLYGERTITLGSFGVPLFFVISGFIMTVLTQGECSPSAFLRRRIARIVPLYWLATAAALALAVKRGWAFWTEPESWGFIASSYLFLPWGRTGADAHFFPVLSVGWTLNYELFFYVLVALSLFLPRCAGIVALSATMLGLAAVGALLKPTFAMLAFWTEPVILQFLAGVWLGAWWTHGRRRFLWPLAACGLALLLANSPPFEHFRGALTRGVWGVAALLAVLRLEQAGASKRPIKPLRLLGDASYSIYLWHPLILIVLSIVLMKAGVPQSAMLPLGIGASVAGGLISYIALERPLLRVLHLRRSSRGVRIPAGP